MIRLLTLSLGLALMSPYALAGSGGNVMNVTTTLDVMNPADGLCSLREALRNANTNTAFGLLLGECPGGSATQTDVIVLSAGQTYTLTLAGGGDNAGDLDIHAQPMVPSGNAHLRIRSSDPAQPATIQQLVAGERVIENDEARVELIGIVVRGGSTLELGGGILNREGDLWLERSQLFGNSALDGGALANNGVVTLLDSEILANSASSGRGGGALNQDGGTLTVLNSEFNSNVARLGGGIANLDGSELLIRSGSRFRVNRAEGTTHNNGNGGAIHSSTNANLDIEGADFEENVATSPILSAGSGTGGAISTSSLGFSVRDSRFVANTSRSNGGAIHWIGGGQMDVRLSRFIENHAVEGGGGAISGLSMDCRNCLFDRNVAHSDGGAISGTFAMLHETTALGNESGARGGAFRLQGLEFSDGVMIGNRAEGPGGAAYVAGHAVFERCRAEGNTSEEAGGAVHLFGTPEQERARIENCLFFGNATLDKGGAIFARHDANLTNVTVSGNSALLGGGGLYINEGTLVRLNHVTLANNVGDNVHKFGTLHVRNSLFRQLGGGNINCVMSLDSPTLTSFGRNLAGDASCFGLDVNLGDLIDMDPLIAPLDNNESLSSTHALLPGSPAIDAAGLAACLDMDNVGLDGFTGGKGLDQRLAPRPFGSACDIGAHEQGAQPPPQIFSDGFEAIWD